MKLSKCSALFAYRVELPLEVLIHHGVPCVSVVACRLFHPLQETATLPTGKNRAVDKDLICRQQPATWLSAKKASSTKSMLTAVVGEDFADRKRLFADSIWLSAKNLNPKVIYTYHVFRILPDINDQYPRAKL